jgi:hypothetical protein
MPHQINKLLAPVLGAQACCCRAGLAFSLLCLALGGLAALSPHRDGGRTGLSRGFIPHALWADQAPRPPAEPARGETPQPARGGQPGRTIPTPAGIPAAPSVMPMIPKGIHF